MKITKYFTNNLKKIVQLVQNNGSAKGKNLSLAKIKSSEMVSALLKEKGCYGKNILISLDKELKEEVVKIIKEDKVKLTAKELLIEATKLAHLSYSPLVGTEHLAQAFIENEVINHPSQSPQELASRINIKNNTPSSNKSIKNTRQTPEELDKEINKLLEELLPNQIFSTSKTKQSLFDYCTDLNQNISSQYSIIGREKEIERIIHILGRKNKNNPILIGDPGVGKTAIIEGLAQKIQSYNVPHHLFNKKILNLDLGQLIAGTTFRGEFEARLKEIMQTVKKNKDLILFIDEIHNLIGMGNAAGGMDAVNILKPAMARDDIQIIGATTMEEYKKYIEKDSALDRRLQPLIIQESTCDETVEILKGIRKYFEKYHQVKVPIKIIEEIPFLAKKYLTKRFLPDSAIDLLDESASRKKSSQGNKKEISLYHQYKQQLNNLAKMKHELIWQSKYDQALLLKDREESILSKLQKQKKIIDKNEKKNVLNKQDILETLSLISGISLELLSNHNSSLSKNINTALRQNLIGQNHLKKKISETIARRLSGLVSENRPLGSFLFIGPTGVGKTMTAKLLAQAISPDNRPSLIKVNMSEFTEKHSLSRLLGAPAGYIGHENEGELSNKISRNPFSVVLFDEIEKADPSILNILLQILDEGELVNAKNKKLDFKNTIIILTSNIGTAELNNLSSIGFNNENTGKQKQHSPERIQKTILSKLKQQLPPELLARLDNILIFNNLSDKELVKIIKQQLLKIEEKLKKQEISAKFNSSVIDFILKNNSIHQQGARFIKNSLINLIEPPIAETILSGKKIKKIIVTVENNKIVVK